MELMKGPFGDNQVLELASGEAQILAVAPQAKSLLEEGAEIMARLKKFKGEEEDEGVILGEAPASGGPPSAPPMATPAPSPGTPPSALPPAPRPPMPPPSANPPSATNPLNSKRSTRADTNSSSSSIINTLKVFIYLTIVKYYLSIGNLTEKDVPFPTSLLAIILPPSFFTIPYVMDRPKPVPYPFFVVKKGSKICFKFSSDIP